MSCDEKEGATGGLSFMIKGAEQVKKEASERWCWRMEGCLRSVEHLLTHSPDWASVSRYFSLPLLNLGR